MSKNNCQKTNLFNLCVDPGDIKFKGSYTVLNVSKVRIRVSYVLAKITFLEAKGFCQLLILQSKTGFLEEQVGRYRGVHLYYIRSDQNARHRWK